MKPRKKAENELKLTSREIETLKALIASLIGERHWTKMLPYKPDPNGFPKQLYFEGAVLRAIYELAQMDQESREKFGEDAEPFPPNFENVLTIVESDTRFQAHKDKLTALMGYRADNADPRTYAKSLKTSIQKTIVVGGLERAIQSVQIHADPVEGWRQGMAAMSQAKPTASENKWYTATELNPMNEEWMKERAALALSGKFPGPIFPWEALKKRIFYLKRGDMNTLVATAGLGKSTLTDELACFWAWEQGGFDVLILSLENTEEDFRDRQIARKLHMNIEHLMNGFYMAGDELIPLNETHPQFWPALQEVLAEMAENERTKGKVMYKVCPGATLEDIEGDIEAAKMDATAAGRQLIVMIDYINEITPSGASAYGGHDDDTTTNSIAKGLKNIIQQQDVFSLVFAQDQTNPDYSKKKAYNGQVLQMRSQVYIRLECDEVADDGQEMVKTVRARRKDGSVAEVRDTFWLTGETIYWHEPGTFSSYVKWNVLKVNKGKRGGADCWTQFCRALYTIAPCAPPKK